MSPFNDIIISRQESSKGPYISMTIRGGLMHVHAHIGNGFDVRRARMMAKALDIPLHIFDDAKSCLEDNRPNCECAGCRVRRELGETR